MKINDKVVELPIDEVIPYNGSHNTDAVVEMIRESINQFGIQQPLILDRHKNVVAGNAIYKAAKMNGLESVPCVILDNLTDDEIAQYRIADNKTSEFAKWNEDKLRKELSYLEQPTSLQFCFDENIQSMLGMSPVKFDAPVIPKSDSKKEAPSIQEQDKKFRESLKEVDRELEAKPRKYLDYVCSKCNRKVTIKV